MAAPVPKSALRFGRFELDLSSGELRKSGIPIRLQPQPAKVLVLLATRAGQLVSREEIKAELWGDEIFVDFEQGLNFCIRQIRQVLSDNADSPLYIETIPKRGYCFIAPVNNVVTPASPPATSDASSVAARNFTWQPSSLQWSAFILALALLGGGGAYVSLRRVPARTPRQAGKVMLAVLPFENMSGDPQQDYFSEGLTDEVITDLGQFHPDLLGVIARTSVMQYRHTDKRIDQIGHELGADYILEGGVSRSSSQLRVNAQLIQVRDQTHLWARSYEFELGNVLRLQDEVAANIAGQIQLKLNPAQQARLDRHPWLDPKAHEDYLKGRYFWNLRSEAGYWKAIEYFQAAVGKDPQYAQAYAGSADAYALISSLPSLKSPRDTAMLKAKEMALTALKLDDSLPDAHTSLAFVEMHYEWKFREAEQEFKRAIDLDPNYSIAHHWYAYDLVAMGRMDEAVAEVMLARQIDPLSAIINTDAAEILYFARRYDKALQQARATVEMDPNFAHAHRVLERIYGEKHMFPEAIAEGQRAVALAGEDAWMLVELANTYALAGKKKEVQNCARRAAKVSPGGVLPQVGGTAEMYVALGEVDRALKVMETAYRRRNGGLILLGHDPRFDGLKSNPRFQQLLQRIGLPQ